jgi:hypothetical protein
LIASRFKWCDQFKFSIHASLLPPATSNKLPNCQKSAVTS